MGHLRQLGKETLVYGLGSVAVTLVSVVLVPVYTRTFAPEEYGVISVVSSGLALLSVATVLGLDNSTDRWFWDTDDLEDRMRTFASRAWCQLVVSTAVALVIIATSRSTSAALLGSTDHAPVIVFAALVVPLSSLTRVVISWYRVQRRPGATAAYSAALAVITGALSVSLIVGIGLGAPAVFLAQVVANLLFTFVAVAVMRDWLHPRHVDLARLKAMLRYALPLIPAAVASWAANLIDRQFLNVFSTKADIGLYQVGYQLASVVALSSAAFQRAWGPFALSIHSAPDAPSLYARAFLGYLWIGSVLATAVSIFAPEALRLVTTPAYHAGHSVVPYLAFSYVMVGLTYVAATGPAIVRNNASVGAGIGCAAASTLILDAALIPPFGRHGAAIATLISWATAPLFIFWRAQRMYSIPYRFGRGMGILALSGLVVLAASRVPTNNLLISTPIKLCLLATFVPALFVAGVVQRRAPARDQ